MRRNYVIETKNVNSLRFENVRVFANEEVKNEWSGIFHTENCDGLLVDNCSF